MVVTQMTPRIEVGDLVRDYNTVRGLNGEPILYIEGVVIKIVKLYENDVHRIYCFWHYPDGQNFRGEYRLLWGPASNMTVIQKHYKETALLSRTVSKLIT